LIFLFASLRTRHTGRAVLKVRPDPRYG
jgi:hypothetical protein